MPSPLALASIVTVRPCYIIWVPFTRFLLLYFIVVLIIIWSLYEEREEAQQHNNNNNNRWWLFILLPCAITHAPLQRHATDRGFDKVLKSSQNVITNRSASLPRRYLRHVDKPVFQTMNPILGQSTYGGPINKAGWKMSNIHATSKPNSIARDIFNRRDWREKQASALQLNESLKKSNNFTPRGRPRMAVSRDPELYEPHE